MLVDRVRGSINVPLSKEGLAEARKVALALANRFERIESSDLDRALVTAKLVAATNKKAGKPIPNEDLTPWYLGGYEGQETHKMLPKVHALVTRYPNHKPPGRGPGSTKPGQSFNSFKQDVLGDAIRTLMAYKGGLLPGSRVLKVTHGRTIQLLRAWAKLGCPDNMAVDEALLCSPWLTEPAGLIMLNPKTMGIEDSKHASGDGIYYLRHGPTEWNGPLS